MSGKEPAQAPRQPTEEERRAQEDEDAAATYAYIVRKAKKVDSKGRPTQCGMKRLIFDDNGKDIPVYCILAIRREYGKVVAATPVAIIVNEELKYHLRAEEMSREEYAKVLEKMGGLSPKTADVPLEGGRSNVQ